jgi:hypothetical protein
VGEPEEIEGLRLAQPPLCPLLFGKGAELEQSGLGGVQ